MNTTIPKYDTLKVGFDTPEAQGKTLPPPFLQKLAIKTFKALALLSPGACARVSWFFLTCPLSRAKHKMRDELLDTAVPFEIPFEGIQLKAYAWGEEGKPVVLLIHGWESRGTALRAFAKPLLEKGYRVVAFDAPAHGDTRGKRVSLLSFGRAIKAVYDYCGGADGVIAHSFGCSAVAFLMSQDASIKVRRLVMVSSGSQLKLALKDYADLIQLPLKVQQRFYQFIENKYKQLGDLDVSTIGHEIQAERRLLVHDKEDDILPVSRSRHIFDKWPHTSMLATEGLGHFKIIKSPLVAERVAAFFD